jgi:hypothetical protein
MRLIRSTLLSVFLGTCAVSPMIPAAHAQIVIAAELPPPPLPVYEQPPIPGPEEWIWTPGYWSYDDAYGYYWVPGTWVLAPRPGLLWTPGYWAFEGGSYQFIPGYWGEHVGFYGGVAYGYGYTGLGYEGGYWEHDHFFYNRTVNNIVNFNIENVYSKNVVVEERGPRISFNGGQGGLNVRPTPQQLSFAHEQHVQPTPMQRQHVQTASHDPALRETENKGRPPVAATSRPNEFKGNGAVPAQSAGSRPQGQEIPHGKPGAAPGAEPHGAPGAGPAEGHGPNEGRGPNEGHGPQERPNAVAPNEPGLAPEHGTQHGNEPRPVEQAPRAEPPHAEPQHPVEPRNEMQHAEPPRPMEPREAPHAEPPRAEPPRAEPHPQPQMQPHPQAEPHMPAAAPHPQPPHPAGGEEHKPERP